MVKSAFEHLYDDPAEARNLSLRSKLMMKLERWIKESDMTQEQVAEVLGVDNDIRALISKDASSSEIKICARKNGMATIFDSGIKMVEQGLTSYEEVCRISTEE